MSKLAEIRPFVQQAAEAIASVVNAEITIVDDQLERIAGTHKFRNEIGVRLPKHFIIAKTIQTGKSFVIEQPGADSYCRGCYHYNDCEDSAFIAAPITLKDKRIGGIGLVAFGNKQKQHLIKRQKNLAQPELV